MSEIASQPLIDGKRPWLEHYPEGVPHTIELPEHPIYQFLEDSSKNYPNHSAIEFLGYEMTYGQLQDAVDRFAASLEASGVAEGDRVAIMLPNCPQMVISFFAVNKLGAVVVNVNPLYKGRFLKHLLMDSGAKTLIIIDRVLEAYEGIADDVVLDQVIITGVQDYLPGVKKMLYPLIARMRKEWVSVAPKANYKRFADMAANSTKLSQGKAKAQDLALLQYTGGTTGLPKGAMLSNQNIVSNVHQVTNWDPGGQVGEEVALLVIPFFHVYGMTVGMIYAMYAASKMILLPRFETEQVMQNIQKHKATLFPGIPTMYVAINNHPKVSQYDLSSIRICLSGAAALPPEVKRKFEDTTGGILCEGYGLTETSPVSTSNTPVGEQIAGSIGMPLPNVDIKILDEDWNELPVGEIGELAIKGPNVMMGYWNNEEATAKVIKDDWFATGDMARMDEDGYFYIADRKKDMIIAGGYNIYPREVEDVLYEHPAVQEVAVIGVADEYRGETVKAFIILKEDISATEEELSAFCKENMASYKTPKLFEFRDELPKSLVGKILRRELVEEEKAKAAKAAKAT